ncbi:MAG TPA: hypothetical protein VNF47_09225 [Streptosporangiaceae bacterium]|nr:hypothetical protein [Streptosporangiaceae bacterium]
MDVLTEPAVTSRGGRSRWRLTAYWLFTAGAAAELGAGGALDITGHHPSVRDPVAPRFVTTGYALGEVPVLIFLTALTVASWALRPASRRPPRGRPARHDGERR